MCLCAPSTSFFFNDTASTEFYTLSLHDALPICEYESRARAAAHYRWWEGSHRAGRAARSEEHTSELQSRENLVCRLLLEKKKLQMTGFGIIEASTGALPYIASGCDKSGKRDLAL